MEASSEMLSGQSFALIDWAGSGPESQKLHPLRWRAGNISPWVGDSVPRRAQSAAPTTRCWQSMVKDGTPHDSDAWTAFEGEVLPHADRLFRLAMWFERNRADAEDVVQETMMQSLRSFHRFRPGTNCRAWLTTILQHEELLTETNHEILRHLDSCPSCRTEIEARRRLRGALRTAFNRDPELQPAGEFADRLLVSDLENNQLTQLARIVSLPLAQRLADVTSDRTKTTAWLLIPPIQESTTYSVGRLKFATRCRCD